MLQAGQARKAAPKGRLDTGSVTARDQFYAAIELQEGCGSKQSNPEPTRQPQVPLALDQQDKLVACMSEQVDELTKKLQPLIPPQPSGDECGGVPAERVLCHIAERIESHNAQLSQIVDALAVLTVLIEL